jgi:vacuolar protein sorting-associated protein 13D
MNTNFHSTIKVVRRQKIRPGSGHLIIKMLVDGPTKVVNISNVKEKSYQSINWKMSIDDPLIENNLIDSTNNNDNKHSSTIFELYINLSGGIGVSIIQWHNQEYEELAYAYLKTLEVNFEHSKREQKVILAIKSVQVCNQTINSFKQNMLLMEPTSSLSSKETLVQSIKKQEVLSVDFLRRFRQENIFTIDHLIVNLADAIIQIEEKLLWKIIQFLGIVKRETSELSEDKFNKNQEISFFNNLNDTNKLMESNYINLIENKLTNNNFYKMQINNLIDNTQSVKYSFNKFQINSIGITLSVYKTSKLSDDLQKLKTSLGIPLIQFENARIECKPFILLNEYDTVGCVLNLMTKHYTTELRSHAIRILGSVDFLGNPIGTLIFLLSNLLVSVRKLKNYFMKLRANG